MKNCIYNKVKDLESYIKNPTIGLPEEIFLFISRITPMVNIDLLIKDENNRTLLSWRNDEYFGSGWHIPGGVLRLKETLKNRIQKVADMEIGTNLMIIDYKPIKCTQFILNQTERCHFISFLYKCHLSSTFIPDNKNLSETDAGFLRWFDKCPTNLINQHEEYRDYI